MTVECPSVIPGSASLARRKTRRARPPDLISASEVMRAHAHTGGKKQRPQSASLDGPGSPSKGDVRQVLRSDRREMAKAGATIEARKRDIDAENAPENLTDFVRLICLWTCM